MIDTEIKVKIEELEEIKIIDDREVVTKQVPVYPELENLEVNPTKEKQTFKSNSYGYDEVVVNPVTNEVDENIKPNNIRVGVNILGVEGTIENIDYWSTEPLANTTTNCQIQPYIKELPKYIDTSKQTGSLNFDTYKALEKADLRQWDLSNIKILTFNGAMKLKEILIDNDTPKLTALNNCFSNCQLESAILKMNTSLVTSMSSCFYLNKKIQQLDLSTWTTENTTNVMMMFLNCSNLKRLDIRNMTFSHITLHGSIFSGIPKDCLIIVKDDTAKSWVLARRSDLTNVKTVAELG